MVSSDALILHFFQKRLKLLTYRKQSNCILANLPLEFSIHKSLIMLVTRMFTVHKSGHV